MDLDKGRPHLVGRLDLPGVRVDEQAYRDASLTHPGDDLLEPFLLPGHVEPALGGQLLAFFRNQGDHVRLDLQGDVDDLLGGPHLQVELGFYGLPEQPHVPVLDVPPVFAEMDDNALGSGQFADTRGQNRVRFGNASGLTQGGDVIDIDGKSDHFSSPFFC